MADLFQLNCWLIWNRLIWDFSGGCKCFCTLDLGGCVSYQLFIGTFLNGTSLIGAILLNTNDFRGFFSDGSNMMNHFVTTRAIWRIPEGLKWGSCSTQSLVVSKSGVLPHFPKLNENQPQERWQRRWNKTFGWRLSFEELSIPQTDYKTGIRIEDFLPEIPGLI